MNIHRLAKFFISSFLLLFIFGVHHVFADVQPLYPVRSDITLDPSTTYVVDGLIVVDPSFTLTIPAGTHFIFTPGSYLRVDGTLIAKGTDENHVVIVGGTPPPYVPTAAPLVVPQIQSSDTQSSLTATPDVSNTVMMTDDLVPASHFGILFTNGSTGTLSYTDISDGADGMTVDLGSTVTASHTTFTNCSTGVLGVRGTLKLTSPTFNSVDIPVDWDYNGTFTHSDSTFNNTGIKGWRYGGDVLAGETMRLNSTDGDYVIASVLVATGGSLIISPGVTVFVQDQQPTPVINGTLTASGTAENPITIYGDGICPNHYPIFSFSNTDTVVIGHVNFHDLCSGITAAHSTVTMTNDTFHIIAGPAVSATDYGVIHADTISMNDVYQAFDVGAESHLTLSNADITTTNAQSSAAISIHDQTAFSGNTISITDAGICMDISKNSSINVTNATLKQCSSDGINSTNDTNTAPSSITFINSEIINTDTAIRLDNAIVANVSNDKFDSNTTGVSLSNMPDTTIINNWWGSNSGPTIASNPAGTGDSIVTSNVASVTYRPWIGMDDSAGDHNPIIIVPGITGSILDKAYSDNGELWPNIAALALSPTDSFLNDLELLPSGQPNPALPITVGDIIRSAPGTDVFDGLIATLLQHGYKQGVDLFVLPYDWRLSNTVNQTLLKDAIANALTLSGKTKVNLIGHSMGGLVIKDFLANNPTAPIDHLFFIGVPHLGAPKAFKALMYGDDMGFNFSIASLINIHVLNPDRIKIITQNMPSVYELLPSQKYIDTVGSYITDIAQPAVTLGLDLIQKLMVTAGRNTAMFPFATKLHGAVDNLDLSTIPTYDFIGCGATKTVGSIVITKKQSLTPSGLKIEDSYHLGYVAGDGTVPVASADAVSSATQYFVNTGSHGTLPSIPDVANAIAAILDGVAPDTSGALSDKSNNCMLYGKIVEVHSPVTLDVYDSQNNHTGPTANGDIEYGIPNVDYETIGDNKFVFLPNQKQDYTIVNRAQAVGTYDMYISDSSFTDTITRKMYFSQIPITSSAAVGTIIVGPSNPADELDVDEKGDGSDIRKFYPTGSTLPALINDVTPPNTDAVVAGNAVMLFAHDAGSGVLNTKYSVDNGLTWNIYNNPFQVNPGTVVQFVSLDEAGNTEDIQYVTVPAATATQSADTATPVVTTTVPQSNNYYYNTDIQDTPPTQIDDSDTETPSIDETMPILPTIPIIPTTATPTATPISSSPTTITHTTTAAVPEAFVGTPTVTSSSIAIPVLNDGIRHTQLLASAQPFFSKSAIVLFVGAIIAWLVLLVVAGKQLFTKRRKDRLE